jgi:Na+/melibiose symporter-like transporter
VTEALLGRNRNFRLLLSAGLISQTGDWVISTGLAYHVYVLTGSTLSSATMLLAARLPTSCSARWRACSPTAGTAAGSW